MKSPFRHFAPAFVAILLATSFAPALLAQAPITNGLVNRWPGDGNAKNTAGHDDGTASGGVRYIQGQTGKAFEFNGTDGGIDFGKAAGNFGPGDFTIAYWMKTSSVRPKEAFLEKRRTCDSADAHWAIHVGGLPPEPGHIGLALTKGGFQSALGLTSSRPLNDDIWHHVAWVRQSTSSGSFSLLLYIDGVLDARTERYADKKLDNNADFAWGADIDNANPMVMGQSVCQCCDGTTAYSGAARELQFLNRALSNGEITAICNAGKSRK